jgi:hypothetical protein
LSGALDETAATLQATPVISAPVMDNQAALLRDRL